MYGLKLNVTGFAARRRSAASRKTSRLWAGTSLRTVEKADLVCRRQVFGRNVRVDFHAKPPVSKSKSWSTVPVSTDCSFFQAGALRAGSASVGNQPAFDGKTGLLTAQDRTHGWAAVAHHMKIGLTAFTDMRTSDHPQSARARLTH